MDLDEYRWDIYPLGFLKGSNSRIAAYGYAYTGSKPIFLGIWSIDTRGQQSRLVTFNMNEENDNNKKKVISSSNDICDKISGGTSSNKFDNLEFGNNYRNSNSVSDGIYGGIFKENK